MARVITVPSQTSKSKRATQFFELPHIIVLIINLGYLTQPSCFLKLKNKNQLDATYCFIILMIGSTCFGHYYAHHQELTTVVLITTGWISVRAAGYSLQPGHLSNLPAPNFQPTAT